MVIALLCNDTATTELYTYRHSLSLHDARPICWALNAKVYALDALGRHDEAADIFDRIVEQPYDPAQSGWMVNFAINRGSRFVDLGQYEKGLEAADYAGRIADRSEIGRAHV